MINEAASPSRMDLETLEGTSATNRTQLLAMGGAIGVVAILCGILVGWAWGVGVSVLGAAFVLHRYNTQLDVYIATYKRLVVPRLLHKYGTDFRYEPADGHVFADFQSSRIDPIGGKFTASDCIEDGRGRRMSHVRVETNTRYSRVLFDGLLITQPNPHPITGLVVVRPDKLERTFGKFGAMIQKIDKSMGELVRFENEAFERLFEIYASDPKLAHTIMTPALQAFLIRQTENGEHPVCLTLEADRMTLMLGGQALELVPAANLPVTDSGQKAMIAKQLDALFATLNQFDGLLT